MSFILLLTAFATILGFYLSKRRIAQLYSNRTSSNNFQLHSLPSYYGYRTVIYIAISGLFFPLLWLLIDLTSDSWLLKTYALSHLQNLGIIVKDQLSIPELLWNQAYLFVQSGIIADPENKAQIKALAEFINYYDFMVFVAIAIISVMALVAGALYSIKTIKPDLKARNIVEKFLERILLFCSFISIIVTIAIILSVLFEAVRFFNIVNVFDFLFGMNWSPQSANHLPEDRIGEAFGILPLLSGTLLIMIIALLVAVPLGIMSAIYLAEYASHSVRRWVKPALEMLAGIPTVVYGYIAVVLIAPFFRDLGDFLSLDISSESALVAGLVMGVMILPFISSLSDDIINSVPQSLRDASYGMGATSYETIRYVVLPAALPGIMGAVLLAMSRAIGETMIVVMAAGLSANLTINPLESVTSFTVQIVTLLVGDQEFDSAKTMAAFALGLTLLIFTLLLNILSATIVRNYRNKY